MSFVSAAAALQLVSTRAAAGAGPISVYVHTASATPTPLLQALADALRGAGAGGGGGGGGWSRGARVSHLHLEGPLPHLGAPRCTDVSYFCAANVRPLRAGVEYAPVPLSALPRLVRAAPPDAALLSVSPPDAHGWCSLGASVDGACAPRARRAAPGGHLIQPTNRPPPSAAQPLPPPPPSRARAWAWCRRACRARTAWTRPCT